MQCLLTCWPWLGPWLRPGTPCTPAMTPGGIGRRRGAGGGGARGDGGRGKRNKMRDAVKIKKSMYCILMDLTLFFTSPSSSMVRQGSVNFSVKTKSELVFSNRSLQFENRSHPGVTSNGWPPLNLSNDLSTTAHMQATSFSNSKSFFCFSFCYCYFSAQFFPGLSLVETADRTSKNAIQRKY